MEKVSIIIPVYKVEPYIERCLLSALGQSYPNIEVILIDDCSPDRSMAIAANCIGSHPRKDAVKIISHNHNMGLSCARNTGINAATGDYVYFLDSDDFLPVDAINLLASPAIKNDADFSIGNYQIIGGNRCPTQLTLPTGIISGNKNIIKLLYHEQWYVMAWNKLIKTDFIKQHNLYFEPGIIHEDDLWTFKVATKARTMCTINETTYCYELHQGAITGNGMTQRHLDCRKAIIGMLHRYINADPSLHTRETLSLFEHYKLLYMRVVHIHLPGKEQEMYDAIRANRLKLPGIKPYLPERLLSFNYRLPHRLGYLYYKYAVWLNYKFLCLKIKLGITGK